MNNFFLTLRLMAAAAVIGCGTLGAAEVQFSYSPLDSDPGFVGTGKSEIYDIAILVPPTGLEGARIIGVEIPFEAADACTDLSGWLTTELKLENKLNAPDICSATATVSEGVLRAIFDEPYEMTDQPVYAGYSFTVTDVDSEAGRVPMAATPGIDPDGLYMHTRRTYLKWASRSDVVGGVSALRVLVEGDFPPVSVSVSGQDVSYVDMASESFCLPVTVTGYGIDPVKEVTFKVSSTSGNSVTVTEEVPADTRMQFGRPWSLNVYVPAWYSVPSVYDVTVEAVGVNGLPNPREAEGYRTELNVLSTLPFKRVLMEEYTGLWCGFCPRGFAAMEYLSETYPYRFIGVAYHSGTQGAPDPMQVIADADFPNFVRGFPISWLDRTVNADPYLGTVQTGFGILDDWQTRNALFSPMAVSVSAVADESGTVSAKAVVREVIPTGRDHEVQFILTADGLSDPSWRQTNYFAGQSPESYEIPQMRGFCEGDEYISGLVFNDVALMLSDTMPMSDAATFDYDQYFDTSFDTSMAVGATGIGLAARAETLHVVALVQDALTHEVINADICTVSDGSDVTAMTVSAPETVSVQWYDVTGRALEGPCPGVCIKTETLSDGTVRATRHIF